MWHDSFLPRFRTFHKGIPGADSHAVELSSGATGKDLYLAERCLLSRDHGLFNIPIQFFDLSPVHFRQPLSLVGAGFVLKLGSIIS